MEKISLDKDSKDLLEEVSSLFGVKSDIIKDVWDYTLIAWLLKMADSDANFKRFRIPYVGSIGLRFLGEKASNDSDKIEADYEAFVSLNDNFKNLLKAIKNNGSEELVQFIQSKIKKIASQI